MQITDKEIQKELNARINAHKLSIVNAYLQQQYMEEEEKSPIKLPDVIAEKNAKNYSLQQTARFLLTGTLEDAYNASWFYLAEQLP